MHCYLFDLLHLDGRSTRKLGLRDRKRLLRAAVGFEDPLRFAPAATATAWVAYLADACGRGWEGLIAKDAAARYEHGRSRRWLKFKCVKRQELVIGGWTDPKGGRERFGALLVGYYRDGRLRYAGKVGTGFTHRTLDDLADELAPRERSACPFDDEISDRGATGWNRSWWPRSRSRSGPPTGACGVRATSVCGPTRIRMTSSASTRSARDRMQDGRQQIHGRTIEVSNAGKKFFPAAGLTKGDLLDYHERIAAPQRGVPLDQRPAQPGGAARERLDLRVHAADVAGFQQRHQPERPTQQLALEVARPTTQRHHLGGELQPFRGVLGTCDRIAVAAQGVDEQACVARPAGDLDGLAARAARSG